MSKIAPALCLLIAASACSGEAPEPVEPAVEMGRISANNFVPYEAGEDVTAMTSQQVGIWLMPSVRYQGMSGTPEISCICIDLDRDEVFAEAKGFRVARDLGDGWNTVTPYLMEVSLADSSMDDLTELPSYQGDRALLECSVVDELGVTRVASLEMTIAVN